MIAQGGEPGYESESVRLKFASISKLNLVAAIMAREVWALLTSSYTFPTHVHVWSHNWNFKLLTSLFLVICVQ